MLEGLICDCASSLPLFRQFLQANSVPDYMSIPIHRGEKAKERASAINDPSLIKHLDSHHSFVILVGISDSSLDWVDINNARLADEIKAKALIEAYAF